MVGHTGVIPAVVDGGRDDRPLPRPRRRAASRELGGVCLITADHGNAEQLLEPRRRLAAHRPHDEPGAADRDRRRSELRDGGELADLAPTVLCTARGGAAACR